ncbi:gene transfer agent family protein [Qipengyuania sp. ASV99]|uniref:gene transfer agent family protein n=1 Tax=Qipengyuania sp. ASV99 TaxID=3399681 RepID=UPI003A4C6450
MSRAANPMRGEAELPYGERVLRLRPSFENLVAAEAELGSLFALVERASEGGITIAEITALLWHCIVDEPRPSRENVGSAVLDLGLVAATKPVRAVLAQVLQGQK